MAINIYDNCTNPITGETFKGLSQNAYSFTLKWTLQPKGYFPFEHVHYNQDEIYHVEKGELKVAINGKEHIAKAGEKIIVHKGERHIASNNREEEMNAIIEFRPALDQEKFIQCYNGLINDGYIDEKGALSIPMMGYCLKKMKCKAMFRPTSIPAAAYKIALNLFYAIGILKGWDKLYQKYTG
jgi:quercetin dioxygenase-like cupin family protein